MKGKIAFVLCALLCAVSGFSLDITTDVLLGGFYNCSNVFTGKAEYQDHYAGSAVDGDYNAVFRGGGGFAGVDVFFNPCPFGVYFRAGIMGISGVERTAGGVTDKIDSTEPGFNMFCDLGGVYAFNFGNFSLNVAPAFSVLFVNSENRGNIFSRVTEDSLYGVGITADIYAKFRYKYFVCSAGCAASFYPLAVVSSADTKISYSTNIRDTKAYNLRPYVAIGFSFRERTSIGAGGD